MKIIRYLDKHKAMWNDFVTIAKNTHFFFLRDYMEYHSDRFNDFSLLIFNEKDKLIAILPANIQDNIIYSHQGLTFGGFLIDDKMKTETMLEIFDNLKLYLNQNKIQKLIYKCIPYIYHNKPSEEDKYALFRNNAKLIRRDVSTTIQLDYKIKYQEQRKRSIKKAIKNELIFEESKNYIEYVKLLNEVLQLQHNTKSVHTLEEIENLCGLFPNNIKLYVAKKESLIVAGTLMFENDDIVHTQYLANSKEGKKLGALDFVIDKLITEIYQDKKYFDFGISNEDNGKYLNKGLIAQKEGFGARAVVHDFYELDIKVNT